MLKDVSKKVNLKGLSSRRIQYLILFSFFFPAETFAESYPGIVAREKWGGLPPKIELMTKQDPKSIIIHHTSSKQNTKIKLETKLKNLQSFSLKEGKVGKHKKPPWGDVPYHFYIDVDGRTGEGRSINYEGDTNTSYDTRGKIQIVLEGDFEIESPSLKQMEALKELLNWLVEHYKIERLKIFSHNDFAETDCPGKNLKKLLPQIINPN